MFPESDARQLLTFPVNAPLCPLPTNPISSTPLSFYSTLNSSEKRPLMTLSFFLIANPEQLFARCLALFLVLSV